MVVNLWHVCRSGLLVSLKALKGSITGLGGKAHGSTDLGLPFQAPRGDVSQGVWTSLAVSVVT